LIAGDEPPPAGKEELRLQYSVSFPFPFLVVLSDFLLPVPDGPT